MLAAKQGIVGARVGQVVAILTTDRDTRRYLPLWARKMGHEYLGMDEERGCMKFFVRRVH
jgi:TusA-related sulfurtransferase